MKKLSLILSLVIAMTAFTGCKKEEKEKANAKTPNGVVQMYIDDLLAMELGDYEDYFTEDAEITEDEFEMMKDPTAAMTAAMPSEAVEMFGEETVEKMAKEIFSTIDYEIDEVDEDGDTAEVTVILRAPDFENLELDEDEMMVEVMGIDPSTATEDDILEWMEENNLDENSTQEDVIETFSQDIVDYLVDVMKDADKVETEGVFTVEKNDGEWRISAPADDGEGESFPF